MTEEHSEMIEQLYRSHYKRLLATAYRHVQDWEIANEIVQDTFAIACKKAEAVLTHEEPLAWFAQTIKLLAYNDRRKRAKYMELVLSLEVLPPGSEPYYTEQEFKLEDMIGNEVTAEEFYLLRRIILEQATYKEVAAELSIGVRAAQKRMQRLLHRLEKIL